ncbi:MAG: Cys-Gln thioester bond-forming surface protein [Oscillospiraceae bacterium]|nr:Cys-Gln thioester bond-forming surface protein [Oscillospiraceae bacterium]
MAKKIKKLLALLLALTLVAGQLAIPAMATGEPPVSEGGEPLVNEGTEAPAGGGGSALAIDSAPSIEPIITSIPENAVTSSQETSTGTVENVSYTDPGTGAQVTGEYSASTDSNGGTTSTASEKSVDTDTSTIVGTTTESTTETKEYWQESTTTPIAPGTAPDENGFTSTGGTKTENTTGEEKTTHTMIQDGPEFPIEETEKTEGQEISSTTTTDTKEKTTEGSTTTNTTDNPYTNVEGGYSKTEKTEGTAEKDTLKDANLTQDPLNPDVELNLSQSDKTDSKTVLVDRKAAIAGNITIPQPEKGDTRTSNGFVSKEETTNANGDKVTTTTTVTYIYDENDPTLIIGYKTDKEVVTVNEAEDKDYSRGETTTAPTPEIHSADPDASAPATGTSMNILLPTKPQGGTVTNADGSTTTTEVKEIREMVTYPDGTTKEELVGYETIKTTKTADGLYSEVSSESQYGTFITTDIKSNTNERIETDTTELTKNKTVTTTTATFYDAEGMELVFNNGKWVYAATMSSVKEGENQGDITLEFLTPSTMNLNGKTWVVNRDDSTVYQATEKSAPDGYDWLYDGVRGEGANSEKNSDLMVRTSNDYHSDAHMFELTMGSGNNIQTLYVYCVDFATTSIPNYYYKMENVKNSDAYEENEREHIQAIAKYGYWGNPDPAENEEAMVGSLAAMKATLIAAKNAGAPELAGVTVDQINRMSNGEALVATQAAFWAYGNKGNTTIDNTQGNELITAVYKWLKNQKADLDESTDIITATDFAREATITIKDKATNEDGTVKTGTYNDNGVEVTKTIYNTDISFTIDVTKSNLTGNLKVSVIQNGVKVREIDLATADSNILGKLIADEKEVGTTVTIRDIELMEGVKFDITLDGAQELKEGAYVFTSEKRTYENAYGVTYNDHPSQTFVALAGGEHEVDLSVEMAFTVSEPDIKVKDPGSEPTKIVTEKQDMVKKDVETVQRQYFDTTVEITETQETMRSWLSEKIRQWSYQYELELYDDDFGWDEEDGGGNRKKTTTILDEDVALADAPKTGDISGLWAALTAISLGGIAVLSVKRKEEA